MSGTGFDWEEAAKAGNVAFRGVLAVAIYRNTDGDIVIVQQAGPTQEQDDIIILPQDRAKAFIELFQRVAEGEVE